MVEPRSFTARIDRERGTEQQSRAGQGDGAHLHVVVPGEPLEGEREADDDGKEYRAYMTAKVPPRLRFKPGWRQYGKSIQWYPTPEIEDHLDRESDTVPQVIIVRAASSVTRIEGFHLGKLADDLNRQIVCEIRAYCPRRWPGKTFGDGELKIISIRYEAIDGRTNVGKAKREGMALVPQESVQGFPEEEMGTAI